MLNGDLDSSTLQATAFTGRSLERRRAGRPSGCGTMVGNESRTLWLRRGPGVERVLAVLVGLSCAMATARAAAPDVIYVGTVVTMESASPRAEAVAVAGERVVTVGKRAEVLSDYTFAVRDENSGQLRIIGFLLEDAQKLSAIE